MTSSKWAKGLVRERKTKEEKQRIEEESRVTDHIRIQANAESAWQNIRSLINHFADELNKAWGSHVVEVVNLTPTTIEVTSNGNNAIVQFTAFDPMLKVSFYGGDLELSVSRSDKFVWQSSVERSKRWTNEEVAKFTIEYAWRPGNSPHIRESS